MKKRILFAIFTLMMFFSACSGDPLKTAEEAAGFYGGLTEFSSELRVTMDHGDYLTDYVLLHTYSGGVHTVTVKEPLGLAGLTVTTGQDSLELKFQDAVFLPQSLKGTGVTPVKLLPDMLESLMRGNFEAICNLSRGEDELVSISMWSTVDGDEFMYRVSLFQDTLEPKDAEFFFDGKRVMTAEFQNTSITSQPKSEQ